MQKATIKKAARKTTTKKRQRAETMDLTGDSDTEMQGPIEKGDFTPIEDLECQQQPPRRKRAFYAVDFNEDEIAIVPIDKAAEVEDEAIVKVSTRPQRSERARKRPRKSLSYH